MPNVVRDTGIRTPISPALLLGYVAENAATNLCLQSQTFDNAAWNKENATIGANLQQAPDGTMTADVFLDDSTNAKHDIYVGSVPFTAVPYTFSVYLKAGTLTWAQLAIYDPGTPHWANFNLVTGAVGLAAAGVTSAITALPNGWYRCSVTFTTAATASGIALVASLNANTNAATPAYVGTGQTMYLWGAQVETGSDPSSYVPTTTVAVVRNNDVLYYALTGNASRIVGTAYAELSCFWSVVPSGVNKTPVGFDSNVDGSVLWATAGDVPTSIGTYDGTTGITKSGLTSMLTAPRKRACAWGGVTRSITGDGAAPATGAFDGTFGNGVDNRLEISAGRPWGGTLRNVKIYNVQFTDADLITMTA